MQIKAITIGEFAGLSHLTLTFHTNFTVLYGANEAGKTTLMRFLLMMLYGGSTKLRGLAATPSGHAPNGSMLLSDGKTDYQLDRVFGKSRRTDRITLTESATGRTIPVASTKEPGEIFLQMKQETFEKSCFIGALGSISGERGSEEIRMKLQNLVSTGEESVSITEVTKRLHQANTEIMNRSQTKGLLVSELQRLAELEAELEEASSIENDSAALIAEKAECEKSLIALHAKKEQLSDLLQKQALYAKATAAYRYEKALKSGQDLVQKRNELRLKLTADGFTIDEAWIADCHEQYRLICSREENNKENETFYRNFLNEKQEEIDIANANRMMAENNLEEAEENLTKHKKQLSVRLNPLMWVGTAVFLIAGILLFILRHPLIASILSVLGIIWAIAAVLRTKEHQKIASLLQAKVDNCTLALKEQIKRTADAKAALAQAQKEKTFSTDPAEEIEKQEMVFALSPFGCTRFTQIPQLLSTLQEALHELRMTEVQIQKQTAGIAVPQESFYDLLLQLKAAGVDTAHPNLPSESEIKAAITANENDIRKTELRLARISGRLTQTVHTHSVAQLEQMMAQTKARIESYHKKQRALALAEKVAEESFLQMQREFGLILRKETDNLLSALTSGRYDQVTISSDLSIKPKNPQTGALIDTALLSAGTTDQAYFALRTAIAKVIAADSKISLPLLLDDCFMQYDTPRTQNAMRVLHELIRTNEFSQVLFFTCHERETELAEGEIIQL